MLKDQPDHHDAELVLRLYDLRREASLREARARLEREFRPRSAEDVLAVLRPEHPLNTAWRQVSTYWEMVYRMASYGICHAEYLLDNSVEGLILFSRVEPFLAELRAAASPRQFQHAEWVATRTELGRQLMPALRARAAALREGR